MSINPKGRSEIRPRRHLGGKKIQTGRDLVEHFGSALWFWGTGVDECSPIYLHREYKILSPLLKDALPEDCSYEVFAATIHVSGTASQGHYVTRST